MLYTFSTAKEKWPCRTCRMCRKEWMKAQMTIREKIAHARLRLNWRWLQLRAAFYRQVRSSMPSLVLVPCEPWSVVGSRGDEAMVYSILRDFRLRHPEGRITIVTGSPDMAKTPS